jgi:pimeloyl-ACP methyl ester carboxylesterase
MPRMSQTLQFVDGGKGEPVVLLHGFPLDGRMWDPQVRELGRGARVIVPDLPGFGRSAALPAASLDQMADDVAALLDTLGVERATVVGLSMGGYIALAFARLHRGRLARLGLCDTRAAPDTLEGRTARNDSIALVDAEGVGALVERMLPKLLSPSASTEVREQVRAVGRSQSPAGVKAALAAMRDRADAREWLPAIDVPTMVVVGADDTLTPPSESESMFAKLPRAKLEQIPHAGHLANLEAPAAFTAALERLLRMPL